MGQYIKNMKPKYLTCVLLSSILILTMTICHSETKMTPMVNLSGRYICVTYEPRNFTKSATDLMTLSISINEVGIQIYRVFVKSSNSADTRINIKQGTAIYQHNTLSVSYMETFPSKIQTNHTRATLKPHELPPKHGVTLNWLFSLSPKISYANIYLNGLWVISNAINVTKQFGYMTCVRDNTGV